MICNVNKSLYLQKNYICDKMYVMVENPNVIAKPNLKIGQQCVDYRVHVDDAPLNDIPVNEALKKERDLGPVDVNGSGY
jgi:hypothetical protein